MGAKLYMGMWTRHGYVMEFSLVSGRWRPWLNAEMRRRLWLQGEAARARCE